MHDVTQADRTAAADLLDELSNLLDHNGIGQVADLARDGEYDEHEAVQAFAAHRIAHEVTLRIATVALDRIADMPKHGVECDLAALVAKIAVKAIKDTPCLT